MKKNSEWWTFYVGVYPNLLRKMKLTLLLVLLVVFQVSATNVLIAQKKVNLEMHKVTLEKVFYELKRQTGHIIMFSSNEIDHLQKVDVNYKDAALEKVLDELLGKLNLGYSLMEDYVVVFSKQTLPQTVKLHKVSGSVKDEKGNLLPGVTVMIKGTNLGAATDVNGEYVMDIPQGKEVVLVFSFIGMKTQEIACKDQEKIHVVMKEEASDIGEVVVTGYFNKAKSSFTGTAKSFTAEDLKQANPVNLLAALSILDPSFKMVENNLQGSNPNAIPEFQIRGSASIPSGGTIKSTFVGNPNMPTFIMDGFEVNAEKVFDLDPMRIESMTILKDAAATAIYGSRASNGVVVINTKQPEAGKIRVLYNLDLSFNLPDLTDYDLLDAREKLQLEKASGYFDPYGTEEQTEMREADYNYRLGLVNKGYNTYWLDKPLHSAVGHKHSLSVEGGEQAMRYSMDLTYENAPGVMKESGRERIGMGVMLLYRLGNVTFKNNITYDQVKTENSPYGSFSGYARMNPYYPYLDDNGNYLKLLEKSSYFLGRARVVNPLYNSQLNIVDASSYSQFINNFGIDWYITSDLRLKGNVAIRQKKSEGTVFKPADHTDFIDFSGEDFYRKGYYQAASGKEFAYDGSVVLSYFKQLKSHMINANAVWNIQGTAGDTYTVRAEGFPDERLDYITFAAQNAKNYLPAGEDYISRLMGFALNAGYTWNDCYLLDLSARFDGSSKFGANSRWAPAWSAGLGWNIHKEKFAENWTWANMLKLRASYGLTGSQSYEPYQAMIMYNYYTQNRYRYNIGALMAGLGNPDLKWQQTAQLNFGMDVSVLNDRLSVSANYYRNRSKNLLVDITLPPSLGYTTYKENLGEMENKGYELEIKVGVIKKGDTYLNLTASGVHNTNILRKISNGLQAWNDTQDNDTENLNVTRVRFVEGESVNAIWGVPSLGINPGSGKEMFIAADGTRTDIWNAADQRVLGCTDPDLEGNLGLNAGWKGLQLNVYFMYRLGGEAYNHTLVQRIENADKRYNTDRRVLQARWQKPGDRTFFKDVKDDSPTRSTSRFIQEYNYLQLSSLSLLYDLPRKIVGRWAMENVRLSFSMNDVFRASSIKAERGLDYPFARAFRTSLRITF